MGQDSASPNGTARWAGYEHAQVDKETLETIIRVGQLLTAELDLQKLVQAVTDAATELTDAEFGAFFYNVVDADGGHYTLYTLSGAAPEAFANFPLPRNTALFGPTFRGEAIVRADDVRRDPRYGQHAPLHGMPAGHLPVVSYLAVPVVSRSGEVLGGLFFGHSRAGVFTERAERVVAGLAAQTAIAMDNARLYEQAQRAVRQRDEFMSIAAHELRTPITTLRGFAQLTLRRLALHQDVVDVDRLQLALQAIDQQSDKLNRLVTQLLDVSQIEAGKLAPQTTPTDLTGLVESITLAAQANAAHHTISLRTPDAARARREAIAPAPGGTGTAGTDGEAGPCGRAVLALVDPLRIEQVVANLVDNAVKYSPEGGPIEVELSSPDSETVHLAVRDHGIGIPAEHRARIFDRFYQAHGDRFAGIGLGLYVSRQIVELHGGRIEVECPPEGGTRFVVMLPAARVDAPADQDADPVPAALRP